MALPNAEKQRRFRAKQKARFTQALILLDQLDDISDLLGSLRYHCQKAVDVINLIKQTNS